MKLLSLVCAFSYFNNSKLRCNVKTCWTLTFPWRFFHLVMTRFCNYLISSNCITTVGNRTDSRISVYEITAFLKKTWQGFSKIYISSRSNIKLNESVISGQLLAYEHVTACYFPGGWSLLCSMWKLNKRPANFACDQETFFTFLKLAEYRAVIKHLQPLL